MSRRMMIRSFFAVLVLLAAALALPAWGDGPQPPLETAPLAILSDDERHEFTVEIADDPEEIRIGMMMRTELAPDAGMLFDMGGTRPVSFWMKDTLVPLDLLFMDADGRILAIAENAVPGSLRRIDPGVPVRAVLEVNAGTADRLDIEPGDTVDFALFESE